MSYLAAAVVLLGLLCCLNLVITLAVDAACGCRPSARRTTR